MLLHQVFSFNSPVWFNVGTESRSRSRACFILAVDDTMESILNWYREEGLIFKGGSGAGPEPLPDPLVEGAAVLRRHRVRPGVVHARRRRQRGHHQVRRRHPAGGEDGRARRRPPRHRGVRRRPRPRRRTRSASCATPGSTWTSAAPTSPRCSTRTPTTRSGSPTSSCARSRPAPSSGCAPGMTGEVIERVDARRSCSASIAQAAWECADPGIQYDDTINDWHTCPESGRITASNPCSEYMHLDNSSCNLASLNLLKFLGEDGTFDAERFAKAVELIITAMDISICFADFPTEPIAETTRAVPPARHRLRQPRRAADGHRARLRLRGRPRAGRGDHLADDRRGLQALRRAGRRGRRRTTATPATPRRTSG